MTTLNFYQKKAVETTEGRVLVLAGAGSGKTRVLICRIAYLIETKKIPPETIMGLTFTNKAAEEMRLRLSKMIGHEKATKVTLSTFHSFCMKILRKDIHHLGFTSNFSLYDENDMKRVITFVLENLCPEKDINPLMYQLIQAKAKGKRPEGKLGEFYDQICIALRAYNALDFDFLMILTLDLFSRFPSVLETYQNKSRYIMIDEYQDTSPMQYKLASMLSKKFGNLCVVGDDDQSIYAWRGAEIEHILNFQADITIKLEQNYRSTSPILKAANGVIKNNTMRHDKTLKTEKHSNKMIEVFHAPSAQDEVEAVLKRLLFLKEQKNLKWQDIAILYRSNQLSRLFELKLVHSVWKKGSQFVRGIPYQVFGGINFFDRSEIKDLLAYMRILSNEKDQEALLRIINYPRRGISDPMLDKLTAFNRKKNIPLFELLQSIAQDTSTSASLKKELTKRAINGIISFVHLYEKVKYRLKTLGLSKSINYLIETIHYKQTLFKDFKNAKVSEAKWENVQEFIRTLDHFEKNLSPESSLENFISEMLLNHSKEWKNNKHFDRLNLMTFHSAKGLEFPAVFLVGIEDHLIPHNKNQTRKGIEEERRLFYVALTRAMETLCISMAHKRPTHGKEKSSSPSRFLFEIPKQALKATSWRFSQ